MKFLSLFFAWYFNLFTYKTPLHLAVEKNSVDIVKLFLESDNTNVNIQTIHILIILSNFKTFNNSILN